MSTGKWWDTSWPVVTGCSPVDDGCRNCWAARLAATRLRNHELYAGLSERGPDGRFRWTGQVRSWPHLLREPLRRRRPRRIFVAPTGDLFHDHVGDLFLDQVLGVAAACPQHQFFLLTKRAGRLPTYFNAPGRFASILGWIPPKLPNMPFPRWPLRNVYVGVSASCQPDYAQRVPHLIHANVAFRFVSLEPIRTEIHLAGSTPSGLYYLDWVVAGGESGPTGQAADLGAVRYLREQCVGRIPLWFKQWGGKLAGNELDGEHWLRRAPTWPIERIAEVPV